MAKVFVSHASDDRDFAEKFVDHVLRHGCDLGKEDLFFSSDAGMGVPSGADLFHRLRDEVGEGLVVAIVSPAFQTRPVCLLEFGAAWVRRQLFPVAVPGMARAEMEPWLSVLAVPYLDKEDTLDELADRVRQVTGKSATRKAWRRATSNWLEHVADYARSVPTAREVAARQLERATRRVTELSESRDRDVPTAPRRVEAPPPMARSPMPSACWAAVAFGGAVSTVRPVRGGVAVCPLQNGEGVRVQRRLEEPLRELAISGDGGVLVARSDERLAVTTIDASGRLVPWPVRFPIDADDRVLAASWRGDGPLRVLVGRRDVRQVMHLQADGRVIAGDGDSEAAHAAAALPEGFLVVDPNGRLAGAGTAVGALEVDAPARWLDVDAATGGATTLVAGLLADGIARVLRILRIGRDGFATCERLLPASATRVTVPRAVRVGEQPAHVLAQIGGEIWVWRWSDLAGEAGA